MSNCVRSSALGLPVRAVAQHGVQLATVREWKKRLEHQAHSRPCHRGGYGLPVVTGAVS